MPPLFQIPRPGDFRADQVPRDLLAAAAVTFLCIPQGVAYAVIADLPPAMGLYAGAIPAIIASLLRSSRHVITGPTNAVSLIIGTTLLASIDADPMQVGVTLALMVGVLQVAAGLLRLGAVVDFISGSVVLGFITGAGLLIGLGQLPNVTATPPGTGNAIQRVIGWAAGLGDTNPVAVAVAGGTAAGILVLRRLRPHLPAALIVLAVVTAAAMGLDLHSHGLAQVGDLAPIPRSLPPLTVPDLSLVQQLAPLAVAITVLCMVESTSMARSLAQRSGQRLSIAQEFIGEGVANIAGSFFGAYPATGSLSRSALNEREGAATRMAGVYSGVMVLLAPLALGGVLNHIPVAALAGLLLVVAVRLVDVPHIRRVLRSHGGDRFAFLGTVLSCFVLSLEEAIYVGVAISLVNTLRRVRLLAVRDLVVDSSGDLREVNARTRLVTPDGFHHEGVRYCRRIHILNVEGSLFFAAAGQLQDALDEVIDGTSIQVLILRLKQVRHLDVSTLDVIEKTARRLESEGRHLLLLGMKPSTVRFMQRVGLDEVIGEDRMFPTRPGHWYSALADSLEKAMELMGSDGCCPECPYVEWLAGQRR
ncbi:MAG: SulP family inorganic anion transporter [Deltaproteobacteria bacterium]|nr:MAG: SulP family inorganic anion transporter [Deltaproteobacteria bacterium]